MKLLRILCVIFLYLSVTAFIDNNDRDHNSELEWIKAIVEKLDVSDYYLTTDHKGNLVITGYFISTAHFGNEELVAMGNYDIFVAKYSKNGELLWVDHIGSDQIDIARIIKVDSQDNVYITGYISGIALFGNYIVSPKGSYDIFTAKYSAEGNMVWVKCEGAEIKTGKVSRKSKRIKTQFIYTN